MKIQKNLIIGALALSLALISATAVFADVETPGKPEWGMGTPIDASLDEYVVPAIAKLMNLSENDVILALDSGTTFSALALAAGYNFDEITTMLESVHEQALELAIVDGAVTTEQAEWLQNMRFGTNGRGRMSGSMDAPRLYSQTASSMRREGRR